MAHFAELNENNEVLRVIVIDNNSIKDSNGNEDENIGIALCKSFYGEDTNWIQTSFNNNFRGQYAGIGSTYVPEYDKFKPLSPHPSWTFNTDEWTWKAPSEPPVDNNFYKWNEESLSWEVATDVDAPPRD